MSREEGHKAASDKLTRNIKRQTSRKFNAEEKIRIVLARLRGEDSSLGIRRTLLNIGIPRATFYNW
jgi:transposase